MLQKVLLGPVVDPPAWHAVQFVREGQDLVWGKLFNGDAFGKKPALCRCVARSQGVPTTSMDAQSREKSSNSEPLSAVILLKTSAKRSSYSARMAFMAACTL